jgi:hypothetical protein
MIRRVILSIGAQSWGLLLIFAVWQVWVMASHYNSIVAVSPVAVGSLRVCCWVCCSRLLRGGRRCCRAPSPRPHCC